VVRDQALVIRAARPTRVRPRRQPQPPSARESETAASRSRGSTSARRSARIPAARQVQLDVFGPVVDLIHELMLREAPLSSEHVRLVEAMVRAVQERWSEPDHGIWELRLPRRHHVHSKVMCWLTLDRAVRLLRRLRGRVNPEWETLRDEVARDVLENGWCEKVRSYASEYGCEELDAAVLHVGLSGLLAGTDKRFKQTVRAVESELRRGPTVYRYHYDDGLPGQEGGFHLCTSWLIDALWISGRRSEARALFERLCGLAGPTGLFSEEYWPETGTALGNHPQAYSHVGIIENAIRLSGS
jgi:GH15 family glucan-1,4-alpha-glucosidase